MAPSNVCSREAGAPAARVVGELPGAASSTDECQGTNIRAPAGSNGRLPLLSRISWLSSPATVAHRHLSLGQFVSACFFASSRSCSFPRHPLSLCVPPLSGFPPSTPNPHQCRRPFCQPFICHFARQLGLRLSALNIFRCSRSFPGACLPEGAPLTQRLIPFTVAAASSRPFSFTPG
jgi:hypothetical protein